MSHEAATDAPAEKTAEPPAASAAEPFVKPTTMLYRNFLAMETEELLRSHPIDGAVLLGGCVVASAVDLAATTVFTVGKIAVKTTGAVVDAVIPDGNDDKDKKESKSKARKSESPPPPSTADYHPATPVYQPAPANTAAVDTAQ